MNLGVAFRHPDAKLSASLNLKPQELSKETSDLLIGVSKKFAPNLKVKAKYSFGTGVSTYYSRFKPSNECSIGATLQVAHKAQLGMFNGFWAYPFNFGIKVNLKA